MVKAKSPKVISQAAKKEEEAALKKKIEEDEDSEELEEEDDDDLEDDEDDDDDIPAAKNGPGAALDDDDDDDEDDDEDDVDDEEDDDDEEEDDDEEDEDSPKKGNDKSPKGKLANQKGSEKRKNDGTGEDGKAKKLKEGDFPVSPEERRERSLKSLFVGGLSEDITEDELNKFAPDCVGVKLLPPKFGTRSAFVEFESEEVAEKNYAALQGKQIDGNPVKVDYAGEKARNSGNAESKSLVLRGITAETTQADVIRAVPLCISGNVSSYPPIIAFVDFESHEDAAKTLEEFKDNLVIRGSKITLEYGRGKPQGNRGGGGGRGGFRGGRGEGRGGGFRGGRGEGRGGGFRGGRGEGRGGGFRGGRGEGRGGGGFRGSSPFRGGDRGGRGRGGFGGGGRGNRSFD